MKKIKIAVSLLLIFIGFLLTGEQGLAYIGSFADDLPNTTIYYQTGMDHRAMIRDVADAAQEHHVSFFLIKGEVISNHQKNIVIYTNGPGVRERLAAEKSIEARTYRSLFMGTTSVSFTDYHSIPDAELEKTPSTMSSAHVTTSMLSKWSSSMSTPATIRSSPNTTGIFPMNRPPSGASFFCCLFC